MLIRSLATMALALISLFPAGGLQIAKTWTSQLTTQPHSDRSHLNHPIEHQWIPQPIKTDNHLLSISATSAYALDVDSAKVLYSHNADAQRPIASITKLVTAMVILSSHQLDETVTIPALPTYQTQDAKLGLVQGQRFILKDLLLAALIPSANDAADALAIYDSGNREAFASKMNALVSQWGIADTHFTSNNGLQEQDNYASAAALAKLAKIALANRDFSQAVATVQSEISDLDGRKYNLATTNQLLTGGRFIGLKTGFTMAAGQSFLGLAKVQNHNVITVVLNSPDRFAESNALADWIDRSYRWE